MMISRFLPWMRIDERQPRLVLAQYVEMRHQVPQLYALLIANAVAVAHTHWSVAPLWLTALAPGCLAMVCGIRVVVWVRRRRTMPSPEWALGQLRLTFLLATLIACAYVAWSLALARYGGPYEQAHVAVFYAITVIGCIFCLMHLPQAAIGVSATVLIPYLIHYLLADEMVLVVIALNVTLVTLMMLRVLLNNFQGFTKLIHSQAESERLIQENFRLAHTDPLTDLPNRRFFFAELERRIGHPEATDRPFAVGLLDLDRFKAVNDTYGHIVGDRLLEQIGQRLAALQDETRTMARLGGDEFGFLIEADGADAESYGNTLCNTIATPYEIDGLRLTVGCSCGIAMFPEAGQSAHGLFDRADYALYNSKTDRRGSTTRYSLAHETRIRSDRAVENALQNCDLEAELSIELQPIFDMRTGRVTMVEALARWQSPTLGPVRPDVFISCAERLGLISRVTLVLFGKSLAALERLPSHVGLAFNLSAYDVTNAQTILAIVSRLRDSRIDPRRLVLEITETAMIRDFELAAGSVRLLRSFGVRIALDDFGTGYSSLSYLHRLAFDELKIDRSFVVNVEAQKGRELLASIVGLCANLKLECVVEGVETPEQLSALRELGCQMFQGYLIARPMTVDAYLAWECSREAMAGIAGLAPCTVACGTDVPRTPGAPLQAAMRQDFLDTRPIQNAAR